MLWDGPWLQLSQIRSPWASPAGYRDYADEAGCHLYGDKRQTESVWACPPHPAKVYHRMLIRKRWLLAATAGSALVYLSGHYKIGGLDQLRIEPRPASSAAELYEPSGQGGNDSWLFPAASAPSGSHRPSSAGPTGPSLFDNLPPWEPQLSVGEKLAVMQQRISDQVASIGGQSIAGSTLLPVNAPIPAPAELDLIRPSGSPGQSPTARRSGPGKPAAVNPVAGRAEQDKLPRIRIASLNLVAFGDSQLEKPHVVDGLATLLREFDIVALQGIQSDRDDILPTIVERLNRLGRQYDYLIGPRVGRGSLHQQFAFVFDTAQVETDRYQLYTVDDPEDLLLFEPLVAWFRYTG